MRRMSQSQILQEFDQDYEDISRDNIGDRTLLQHHIFKSFQELLQVLRESKGSTHNEVAGRLRAIQGIDIDASNLNKSQRKNILSQSYCFGVKDQQELIPKTDSENTLSIIVIHDIQDGSFGIYSGTLKGKYQNNRSTIRFVDELLQHKKSKTRKLYKWLQCFDQDPDRFRLYVWSKCNISRSSSVAEIVYENAAIRLLVWIIVKNELDLFFIINSKIHKTQNTLQCFYAECIRKYHNNSWDEYYQAINVQSESAQMMGSLLLLPIRGYNKGQTNNLLLPSVLDPNNADNVVSVWNCIHYNKTTSFCSDCNVSLNSSYTYTRRDDDQVLHKYVHRIDNLMTAIRRDWNQIRLEGNNNPTLNALWTEYIGLNCKSLQFKITKSDKKKNLHKKSYFQ